MQNDGFLFGCLKLKAYFSGLVRDKKLSHAYLIEGPEGSGKKSLSKYIASLLACAGNCDGCRLCQRIKNGYCPDVRLITRDEGKKNISVDAVREMIDDTSLTPTELDFKMYIFDGAETLSSQAQNSLLKVIEEPPENVYIMLLCCDARTILPTVRSRAVRIPMTTESPEEIRSFLKSRPEATETDEEKLGFAVRLCEGSLGKALGLLKDDGDELKAYNAAKAIISAQTEKNRQASESAMIELICKAAPTREAMLLLCSYLLKAYRCVLGAKTESKAENGFFDSEQAAYFGEHLTFSAVSESVRSVTEIALDGAYNFNAALAAPALAVMIWRAS